MLIAYLVPDGRPLSRRCGSGCGSASAAFLFLVGAAGDASAFRQEHDGQAPPLRCLPEPLSDLIGLIGLVLVVLLFFGSTFAVRSRLKGATGETRLQLLWLVWGALAVPLGLLVAWTNHLLLGDRDWLTDAAPLT